MAANGMTPCQPRKKARTTVQAADLPGRPDRLRRNFTANAPAVTWVGDITYIPTWQGVRLVWPRSRGCIWQENHRPRHGQSHAYRTDQRGTGHGNQGLPTGPRHHSVSFRPRIPVHIGRVRENHGRPRDPSLGGTDRHLLRQRGGRVLQRHPEEGTREPQGLPDQSPRDPGRDILDRTEIQSQTTPAQRSTTAHPTKSTPNPDATTRQPEPDAHHCPRNIIHSSVKDPPRLQVGDGPLDGGWQRADDFVGLFWSSLSSAPLGFLSGVRSPSPSYPLSARGGCP